MTILFSQGIQFLCSAKLILDGTDWWRDPCFRSASCIPVTTAKMLVSLESIVPLSASIISCISRIMVKMLVSLEPITSLTASLIPCIARVTAKTFVFLVPIAPLMLVSSRNRHRQHGANMVVQPNFYNTCYTTSLSSPISCCFVNISV